MSDLSASSHVSRDVADKMNDFTDDELITRLHNFEDHYVERKSSGDTKDVLKTAVAFANSVPTGYPAILFLGVKDDGTIEGDTNLDSLQKTLSRSLDEAYPPIYYTSRVIRYDGRQCLAVIIPGSSQRPHFAGHSYVRQGSQTKKTSESQFSNLISQRNGKAYEILRWKGKEITLQFPPKEFTLHGTTQQRPGQAVAATVVECNQFYLTLQYRLQASEETKFSYPLKFIEISFDNARDRLEIILAGGIY